MAQFDLDKYQTVQQRIDLFWKKFPEGRFNVDIVDLTLDRVVIRAQVWTDWAEEFPRCVDFAEERISVSGVNKTSHIENGSTSALGRAISQLGGELSPSGLKPSREEMEKVQRLTFSDEALKLAEGRDLDGLRVLYSRAKQSNAGAPILEMIKAYADGLTADSDSKG
jgi:hypothetical protein